MKKNPQDGCQICSPFPAQHQLQPSSAEQNRLELEKGNATSSSSPKTLASLVHPLLQSTRGGDLPRCHPRFSPPLPFPSRVRNLLADRCVLFRDFIQI